MPSRCLFRAVILIALGASTPALSADQHWIRVSSSHFTLLTDADRGRGHEIVARFEQMRSAFAQMLMRTKLRMSKPLEIIAPANGAEYGELAPIVNGQPMSASGFWLETDDRIFVGLNAADPDSWRGVEHEFAHYLLNYNYPPTQPWFDEGFAEYFSSLYFSLSKMELGGDPEANALTQALNTQPWMPLPTLFESRRPGVSDDAASRHHLFYAQSWILMHYLISQDKLSETGSYFELVKNRHVPVPQAIQQAYGIDPAQLEQSVKDYFHSLKPLPMTKERSRDLGTTTASPATSELAAPFAAQEVADTTADVPLAEALALAQEMKVRLPERRQSAVELLEKLNDNPKTETAAAHRALAWAHVQKGETNEAFEELNSAVHRDPDDPWTRLGLALASYHSGQQGARVQGLANMMEGLHIVIDRFPDYAEAYNMQGWARLAGGGANAALESMKIAVQLSPRDEQYQLRLARAFLAAKQFENAKATLERLAQSDNAEVASAARKDLRDLPFLQKYGVPPAEQQEPPKQAAKVSKKPPARTEDAESAPDSDEQGQAAKSSEPTPARDTRPLKFLKGKLLTVDCSNSPQAVLTVSEGAKRLRLRAADYKSLLVMGAEGFSCDWKDVPVAVNYRPGGKADGDVVSVEVR